jgi:IS605 OrfB family transposase
MTARKLREWRGVKLAAAPSGAAAVTRLRTTPADDQVLNLIAAHLGRLRRADLAAASRPAPFPPGLDAGQLRQARRDRLSNRKRELTAQSSSRWASAVFKGTDEQYRLARRAQASHLASLQAAVTVIGKRLAQPSEDTLTREERAARKKARLPKGYATQAERFQKQRRLQHLNAEIARVSAGHDAKRVHVTEGGARLARTRHNLQAAGLTEDQWREQWDYARWRIEANGSSDEPYGNLTITVTPAGEVSLRLPRPLEHLANALRGRYRLSGRAVFRHRGDEWSARITSGQPVSYAFTRRPGRDGVYLTASWGLPQPADDGEAVAHGPVIGVDLNDGHLAVRRLDEHGNPAGRPLRIEFSIAGTSARRDAQVRHAITRLIRHARRHGVTAIAVEDLNFADARATGRETMGRGRPGKRFRRTVSGIPTAVFRNRLAGMTARAGIRLWAVNPAYTSQWGDQHWRRPYQNVTRHEAAATVTGRRAQGHKARRREGVTRTRPEDRVVRATDQAGPNSHRATTASRTTGRRGTKSRPPGTGRTRMAGRPTVTPAQPASNGQQQPNGDRENRFPLH